MLIRFALESELPRVNELRAQVSELHAAARPDFFRPGFPSLIAERIDAAFADERQHILVAEQEGQLAGFAFLEEVDTLEHPHKPARHYMEVNEFGVDAAFRRQGVGRAIFAGIKAFAKERGFDRIELDVWEFNENALQFYESVGFTTYRRLMELTVD